ncbi:MAG: hypothetical protein ACOVOR_05600 [Rhabdochlamydiaceae bacterium]
MSSPSLNKLYPKNPVFRWMLNEREMSGLLSPFLTSVDLLNLLGAIYDNSKNSDLNSRRSLIFKRFINIKEMSKSLVVNKTGFSDIVLCDLFLITIDQFVDLRIKRIFSLILGGNHGVPEQSMPDALESGLMPALPLDIDTILKPYFIGTKIERLELDRVDLLDFIPKVVNEIKKHSEEVNCLTQLKALHFYHGDQIVFSNDRISSCLLDFLQMAPELQEISMLSATNPERFLLSLPHSYLENFKKIDFSKSNVSIQELHKLLQLALNLKELDLSSCLGLSGFFNSDIEGKSSLEKLTVRNSDISISALISLLRLFPDLKELDLYSCEFLKGSLEELHPCSLPKLEKLFLDGISVSKEALSLLLTEDVSLEEMTNTVFSITRIKKT